MIFDRRSSKLRIWICMCCLLVFLLYLSIYADLVTDSMSSNSFKQILTTLYLTSYIRRSNSSMNEPLVDDKRKKSVPSEAFVTFVNKDMVYRNVLMSLIESVHYFSTRPIIVYGIDVTLDLDTKRYPRVIEHRLNQTDCGSRLHFCKIHAIMESQIDYGVHLDADSVVNWNIDILFDVVRKWPYPLPLAPRHPGDPINYEIHLGTLNLTMEGRTIPYIHAQFSWNYRAYPFFSEVLNLVRRGHFVGANYDETAVNILLWKLKSNHTLCTIDPFFKYLSRYESQEKSCENNCHMAYMIFHGSKWPGDMHKVFLRLKNSTVLPFIQSGTNGFHYLNETQYTCCQPDSRPSPIHPLICEYPIWKP